MHFVPDSQQQWVTFVTEAAIGLPRSDRASLTELVSGLPFELTMMQLSRILGELQHIRLDAHAQLALAHAVFHQNDLMERIGAFIEGGQRRIVFGEQNLTALQRLLILHGTDDADREQMTADEIAKAQRAIVATPTVVEAAEARLRDGDQANQRDALAYSVQNGNYNIVDAPLNRLVRTHMMFVELARDAGHHHDACPLDEWLVDACGLTAEQQFAIGYGLHAAARLLIAEPVEGRGVIRPPENSGLYRSHRESVQRVLTADRDWYRVQFEAAGDDDRALAWERTPFLQRPLLRYSDEMWRVISPRALDSWLSDGFYHRALQAAQRRDEVDGNIRSEHTLRFTRYFGHLAEQYVLTVATSVYVNDDDVAVIGEQQYGRRGGLLTSDVAIASARDLVLLEVVSARLTRAMQVQGDPLLLPEALERMVLKKSSQLDRVIRDVRSGRAVIPGVAIDQVERIWPVVVTAGGTLFQTDLLWDEIDESVPEGLRHPPVMPLSLFDLEGLETLLGHVALGFSIAQLLQQKRESGYGRREFIAFQHDVLGTPNTTRPRLLEARFAQLGEELPHLLQLDPE